MWTDGSRRENERVGAAIAFKRRGSWKEQGTYLGRNKVVFDAELFAIGQAREEFEGRKESNREYTIFSDSQAAISRIQHDRTGPGQSLAVRAIAAASSIATRGNRITIRWTPSHMGITGNE